MTRGINWPEICGTASGGLLPLVEDLGNLKKENKNKYYHFAPFINQREAGNHQPKQRA